MPHTRPLPPPAEAATSHIPADTSQHRSEISLFEAQARLEGFLPKGGLLFGKKPSHDGLFTQIQNLLRQDNGEQLATELLDRYYTHLDSLVSDREHKKYIGNQLLLLRGSPNPHAVRTWLQFQCDRQNERILSPTGPIGKEIKKLSPKDQLQPAKAYLTALKAHPYSKNLKRAIRISEEELDINFSQDIKRRLNIPEEELGTNFGQQVQRRLKALRNGEDHSPSPADLQARLDKILSRPEAPPPPAPAPVPAGRPAPMPQPQGPSLLERISTAWHQYRHTEKDHPNWMAHTNYSPAIASL